MKTRIATRSIPWPALAIAACLSTSGNACADDGTTGDWRFRLDLYGFFPEIGGQVRAAVPGGGAIDVDADDLIENFKVGAMGGFEARKGRWGLGADLIYMNVGDSIDGATAVVQGTVPLPAGVTADASLDVKALALTLAASYRVVDTRTDTFDVFGGARLLDATADLEWQFDTPEGPLPPPQGQGRIEGSQDAWDGIVGIRGQHRFGARSQWFVPYYLDAGGGDSDLTWQAATGIGYRAGWGETFLVWRHLDYDFDRGEAIADLSFSGPAVGIAFSW